MSIQQADVLSSTDVFTQRFDALVLRVRDLAATAVGNRRQLIEVADELARLRRDLGNVGILADVVEIDHSRRGEFGHGTEAGFAKHHRRGETPCTACKSAHAEYKARHKDNYQRYNARQFEAKNKNGLRYCQNHDEGGGAWLPIESFDVKDRKRGTRKTWCRECTLRYQRERYARVGTKVVTIEVLEGDECVGEKCPGCRKPFKIGEMVQGDNLCHVGCFDRDARKEMSERKERGER